MFRPIHPGAFFNYGKFLIEVVPIKYPYLYVLIPEILEPIYSKDIQKTSDTGYC